MKKTHKSILLMAAFMISAILLMSSFPVTKKKQIILSEITADTSKIHDFLIFAKWEFKEIPNKVDTIQMWVEKDDGNGFKGIENSYIMSVNLDTNFTSWPLFVSIDLKEGDKIRVVFQTTNPEKIKVKCYDLYLYFGMNAEIKRLAWLRYKYVI